MKEGESRDSYDSSSLGEAFSLRVTYFPYSRRSANMPSI